MISSITRANSTFAMPLVTRGTAEADNSFGDVLAGLDNELMRNAPDKWVTEPGLSDNAVKAALDYKKNVLGIDDQTEPTHELTPEQRDWLNSRYDFSAMKTGVWYSYDYGGTTQYRKKATPEYSNFLADLAYLGVCAPEDFIQVTPIDTRPGGYSVLSELAAESPSSDDGLLDSTRMMISHLRNMFDFYNERSKNSLLAVEGDREFAALIKERYLPAREKFFELIDGLIGNERETIPQSGILPVIEDASEKLKEDFGKI